MTSAATRSLLIPMGLVALIVSIDGTAATVALPMIQRELSLDPASLQWTTTAFMVSGAAVSIPAGAVGDRLGRRRVYLIGLAILLVGSLITALSPSGPALVIGRAIAGCGGAISAVLALALVSSAVPANQVVRVVGLWAAASSAGAVIGPMVAGGIIEVLGWRLFFAVNLIPLAATGYLVLRYLPKSPREDGKRVSVGGVALLTAASFGLAGGISVISRAEGSPWAVGLLIGLGVMCGAVFIWREGHTRNPLVDWKCVFARPLPLIAGLSLLALIGFALTGSMYQQTLALQNAFKMSPMQAGAVDVGAGALYIAAAAATAWFVRNLGVARTVSLGLAVLATGIGALALADQHPGFWELMMWTSLLGVGVGIAAPALNATALEEVQPDQRGAVSGLLSLSSQLASVLGIAAFGAFGAAVTRDEWLEATDVGMSSPEVLDGVVSGRMVSIHNNFGHRLGDVAYVAYVRGVEVSDAVSAVLMLLGALAALIVLRKVRLGDPG